MTAGESNECWRGYGKIGTLMHCWWSCELIQFWMSIWNYAQRALKNCLPFDPAIPLLGLYPKEIIRKKTCTKIFLAEFFVVAKKKNGKWGYVLQLGNGWTSCGICWWWNTIVFKGIMNWSNSMWTGMNWNDLQELMQSERRRTRRTLYTETDTLWYNRM